MRRGVRLLLVQLIALGLLAAKQQNPYQARLAHLNDQLKRQGVGMPTDKATALDQKGVHDPHRPVAMQIYPQNFTVPLLIHEMLQPLLQDDKLELSRITPAFLSMLDPYHFHLLITTLATVPLHVKWKDAGKHSRSGKWRLKIFHTTSWDRTNAAAALALQIGIKGEEKLFAFIIAEAPFAILPELHNEAASLLDARTSALALITLISRANAHEVESAASAAARIVHAYIAYWAGKKPDRQLSALSLLVLEAVQLVQQDGNFSAKQKGVILGAIMAGSLLHAQTIKRKSDQKLWLVNSISNLSWASATFFGVIPIAGSVIAAIAGTVSVAVVVWAIIEARSALKMDFRNMVMLGEGSMEMAALDSVESLNKKSHLEALDTLAWMRGVIHINGLVD